MAITIIDTPADWMPAYNELVFTASSSNVVKPNFNYIVDVYIGTAAIPNAQLFIAPEPNTGNGYLIALINRVIENYVTSQAPDITGTLSSYTDANASVSYRVEIGERYEVTGVLTEFPSLYISSTFNVLPAALDLNTLVNFNPPDYLLAPATPIGNEQFLTRRKINNTLITDKGYLYYVNSNIDFFEIKTYDANGVLLGTWTMNNHTANSSVGYVAAYPEQLNTLLVTELTSGVLPIVTSSTSYYTIQAMKLPAAAASELITFNIIDECKYTPIRLHYLNRLGGFDTFDFVKKSEQMISVESKQYKKNPTRITSSGGYKFKQTDIEDVKTTVSYKKQININSDFLTDAESQLLDELVTSQQVYIETNGLLEPCILTDSSYTYKSTLNDKVFNLNLTIELRQNYSQRG